MGFLLSLKQKIWISYFLVFSVPFLILGGMVYYNAVISLQHELEQASTRQLKLVSNETDRLMQEMDELSAQLAMDYRLTPFMVSRDGYSQLETVRELARYRSYSPLLKDILLYYYGEDQVFSTLGSMSLDTLEREYYRFLDRNTAGWFEDTEVNTESEFIKAVNIGERSSQEGKTDLIAYVSPIPRGTYLHYGKIVLLLDSSSLTNQLESLLGDLQGSIFVLDESRQVMAYRTNLPSVRESISELALETVQNSDVHEVEWAGVKYSLAYAESGKTGWSFIICMPTEQFLSRVINMKLLISLVLIGLICVGLFGSLIISRRQYRPIRRLFQNALDIAQGSNGPERHNELEYIGHTLSQTYRSKLELSELVDLQKEVVRERFLLDILQGNLSDQEVRSGLQHHDVQLIGDSFFVLIVDLENGPEGLLSADQKEEITRVLIRFVFQEGEAYGAKLDWEKQFALIVVVNHEQGMSQNVQLRVVKELQQRVQSRIGVLLTVAAGQIYTDLISANRSFIEATSAMEYRLREGNGSSIFFNEINAIDSDDLWYPVEEQIRFVQSMKQGDASLAADTLRNIMQSIASREQSLLMLRLICSDLINAVFKTMREIHYTDSADKIRYLTDFVSLQDLEHRLQELAVLICNHVVRSRESSNSRLRDEVVALTQSRYRSYDFSLEQLAVHFRLSSSYLSRFIKEQIGMTFTDYVQQLRQNEVKRLLLETDWPVKEIVLRVGYVGVSKFIEKFRKQEGITPGEYRRLHKTPD